MACMSEAFLTAVSFPLLFGVIRGLLLGGAIAFRSLDAARSRIHLVNPSNAHPSPGKQIETEILAAGLGMQ